MYMIGWSVNYTALNTKPTFAFPLWGKLGGGGGRGITVGIMLVRYRGWYMDEGWHKLCECKYVNTTDWEVRYQVEHQLMCNVHCSFQYRENTA